MIKKLSVLLLLVFTVLNLFPAKKIKVYYKQVNNKQYSFFADNVNLCPYQVLINLEIPENMKATETLPFYGVVPQDSASFYLFSILTNEPTKDLEFKYTLKSSMGNPNLVPELDYEYIFPFNEYEAYRMTQGYNGRFSHKGWSRFSVDFGMSTGSSVCAARDGVVTDVKSDSNKGGRYYKYRYMANYITVLHEDGTFAQYMHLKKNGNLVKVGDFVRKGQVIGYSGNTGWSLGPHLHFMVFKPTRLFYETVPTKFIGEKGIIENLESKRYYFSYHTKNFDDDVKVVKKENGDDFEEENLGGF